MTPQKYRDATQLLLQQAGDELAAGDARQAAEKGWGAAAQKVKAVCEERGWRHHSHHLLRQAVNRITEETRDDRTKLLFESAQNLHKNFYEDFYNVEGVGRSLVFVREFIDKLDDLTVADTLSDNLN